MPRPEKRLSAREVATIKAPGRYSDGGGLYLLVDEVGRRSWIFRYQIAGRRRDMGLGSAAAVGLAEARQERDRWRAVLRGGKDPIMARVAIQDASLSVTRLQTFGEAADALIAAMEHGWRSAVHRDQWKMTLEVYAKRIRAKPVAEITTADILTVLKPIWQKKPETASRLRGRMEAVLDSARALGYIDEARANPARWKGHLDKLLSKRHRLSREHHAAMPYRQVPAFLLTLREEETVGARALEFAILTAARTGEVLGARWEEIDLEARLWTVPAARMKAGRLHRAPLSHRALAVLQEMRTIRQLEPQLSEREKAPSEIPFVFPGRRQHRPLSGMVFSMLLRRQGLKVTAHGFRSSFRDWAGDVTAFPRELAEAALAHIVGDQAEQAYRRSDALERRRELMQAWTNFLDNDAGANVIRLRSDARSGT
jgi:integrase